MTKKLLKIAGYVIAGIAILALLIIIYIVLFLPNIGAPAHLKVNLTPERVQHGRYLAMNVAGCINCHSTRDASRYAGPLVEGTQGKGGFAFNLPEGRVVARNITPAGIGDWTDGELFRAITSGVGRDGLPLFPIMPYLNYGKMDKEDIYDIIAFIRTLPAIQHPVEKTDLHFPMNIIVHTIPIEAGFSKKPDPSDTLKYGAYMVTFSGCSNCHSPKDKGSNIPGREFSGGFDIPLSRGGVVHSANITPDRETGIGNWTEDMFLRRFKACLDTAYTHPVNGQEPQTEMPWTFFAKMDDGDLRSIFAYLRTVKPVRNKVSPFTKKQ